MKQREKSELNCYDRYEVAENIPTKPLTKRDKIVLSIVALVIVGIPVSGMVWTMIFES